LRVFKTKGFAAFAKKAGLTEVVLCKAVKEAERGLVAADLGGGLIKLRIARPGQGKSGGFRTLLAFRLQHRAFFVYGFAKSERDNIGPQELLILRDFASELLSRDEDGLQRAIRAGELVEMMYAQETIH